MRILHTSDLHLGRQFNGIPLDDDHAAILNQIVTTVIEREVDILIIAGDIYDRASPPETAVRLFNTFLNRIAYETDAALVMIAGNHDSGHRIEAMSIMTDKARALIRGGVIRDEEPLILGDRWGTVAFSALPFAYEYAARECFEDEAMQTPEHVLRAQLTSARAHVPDETRWVVIAHAFVSGAAVSESERSLTRVGGIETVPSSVFDGAAYVALGHLHRPQTAGADHIRYSGSPLAFGFDESGSEKSMCLIELDGAGGVEFETVPYAPIRQARVLRGTHAELLLGEPSEDFVKAILTDDAPIIDGMKRLRAVFPNACDLVYERDERPPDELASTAGPSRLAEPIDVISDFVGVVRADAISDEEFTVAATTLQQIQEGEDAE